MHESNPLAEMNALDTIRERQQTVSRLRRPRKGALPAARQSRFRGSR